MKLQIGNTIQRLRVKQGYTQEDLAVLCNISSAAISKWENNQSYPDITTLPILARIFDITIDELLNFEAVIDDSTIENLIKEMIEMFNKSYEEGMKFCKTLVYTYPNSERLKLKIAGSHVTISLCLYKQQDAQKHVDAFSTYAKSLCKQIIHSNDLINRHSACILYSNFAKTKEEIRESLEYIQEIPKLMNTASIESSLYLMLEERDKAKHLLQTQLYHDCSSIMLYFTSLIQIAQQDNQFEDAYTLLQLCEQFNETMQLHSIMIPQLSFQYASLHDEENTLRLLKKYVEQANDFDSIVQNVRDSLTSTPWFSTIKVKKNMYPKGILSNNIRAMIRDSTKFSFLQGNETYEKLLEKLDEHVRTNAPI